MTDERLARVAKGKRPIYFSDPATDKLMAMLLAVVGELSVCRERLDTLERLLQAKQVLNQSQIDDFRPDGAAIVERQDARDAYIARVMRIVTQELQATDEDGATESFSAALKSMLEA